MEMNRNLIRTSLLMIFMSIPVGYSNVVFAEAPVYSLDPVYVVGAHKVWIQTNLGILLQSNLTIERAEMWKW
mgnify:CR=1 FL=1